MQLKISRSQKASGMLSKSVVFCLDARVDLSQEERHLIDKYKIGAQVIYNSAASAKHLANAGAALAGPGVGTLLKGTVSLAMSKLSLNITIDSLAKGHHIECKDLDEVLGAEEAIMQGCRLMKAYLDTAATFDGREVVIDFNEQSELVAA